MSRRPENPLPVRERIPPAINKTTRWRLKIVKPKLNVRNQLSRFVASYLETVRLTGPTGVW